MENKKIHAHKKMTQQELKQDLENDRTACHELDDVENYPFIECVMCKIERIRSERQDVSPAEFTQKKLAEKAGIGLTTYKDYLSGLSDNIKLKTVLNIAHVLGCRLSDLLSGDC